jgi:hypothetical protein
MTTAQFSVPETMVKLLHAIAPEVSGCLDNN